MIETLLDCFIVSETLAREIHLDYNWVEDRGGGMMIGKGIGEYQDQFFFVCRDINGNMGFGSICYFVYPYQVRDLLQEQGYSSQEIASYINNKRTWVKKYLSSIRNSCWGKYIHGQNYSIGNSGLFLKDN